MTGSDLPTDFFRREDESPDENFYQTARLTTHIDDATIANITEFYRQMLVPADRLLDLMSSWISHLPPETDYARVSGLGMNQEELEKNPRLHDFHVHNLNDQPVLPFPDSSFDAAMIIVSIQYLTRPFEVFGEISRILAPAGKCIVAMSHRLFPTKAVYAFKALPPEDRCKLVASYMHQTGVFEQVSFFDRSPMNADPLWLVMGTKLKS